MTGSNAKHYKSFDTTIYPISNYNIQFSFWRIY